MTMLRLLLLGLLIAGSPGLAGASPANPQRFLLGAAPMSLGGVSGALEPSAWHNPATPALVERLRISTSLNAYGFERVESNDYMSGEFGGGRAQGTMRSSETLVYPAALAFFLPVGSSARTHQVLSLSILIPDQESVGGVFRATQESQALELRSRQQTVQSTTWILPSWSICLVDQKLCLGAAANVAFFQRIENTLTTLYWLYPDGSAIDFSESYQSKALIVGLGGSLGVQAHFLGLEAGLSVLSPTRTVFGSGSVLSTYSVLDSLGEAFIDRVEVNDPQLQIRYPWRVKLGLGFERSGRWAVGLDLDLALRQGRYAMFAGPQGALKVVPVSPKGESVTDSARAIPIGREVMSQNTLNAALGGRVFLSPKWTLQAGIFTDLSTLPEAAVLETWTARHNRVGVALGVGWGGEALRSTLTVTYLRGWGGAPGFGDAFAPRVASLRSHTLILMFGGAKEI